jgi:hypothetical protein
VRLMVDMRLEDDMLQPPAPGETLRDRLRRDNRQDVRREDPRGARTQSGRGARGGASRTPRDHPVASDTVRAS